MRRSEILGGAAEEFLPQLVFVMIQLVTIRRPLLEVDLVLGVILPILLAILLKLLEVFLQIGRIARGEIRLDILQVGLELLPGLLLLACVLTQSLTIFRKVAPILLDLLVSRLGGTLRF